MADGPRAGDASASAVNVRVSPLAIVPASVFNALNGVTSSLNLPAVDSTLGNASLQVDYTNVKGALGSANVYGVSEAHSSPVVVDVRAIATLMNVLQSEINNLGLGSTLNLQSQLASIQQQLPQALQPYFNVANQLATAGHFAVPTADVYYKNGVCTPVANCVASGNVIPAFSDPTGGTLNGLVSQLQALAPYTATASDGDTTAKHNVEATSSVDALSVLNALPINANLANSSLMSTLQNLINTLEAALPAAVQQQVQGTPVSSLGSVLSTVQGTVGTVTQQVNAVVPAGTPLSTVTPVLTNLLNLQSALNALNTPIDLSNLVATDGVASDVTTTVTNGLVHSIATTKAADVKILTLNSPVLSSVLGGAQGNALAEIIGATATAETTADGHTSHASGSGQFTEIKLLPGSALAASLPNGGDIKFADLETALNCNVGGECIKNVGPLQIVIDTGVCSCHDATNGGTPDSASASVSALEIKINYLGGLDNLLAAGTAAAPAVASEPLNIADVQLATAAADSGNNFTGTGGIKTDTGSPYGTGLLVGFLLLAGAAGMGVTYRRLSAIKAGRS